MREAREIFFDREFVKKLDTRRDLLCFTNGVYDFSTDEFRPGKPEDYISKCTQHEYRELDEERDKDTIVEIEHYFHQLFPKEELYQYMWYHMASLVLGETERIQALHYYIGVGSNGKSLMISFLEMTFGDYATALDANYFTSGRGNRGSATPDIAKLPGVRLAITQEPTEAGKSLVLSEGPMKQLTSGTDKIVYRGLYKDEESFVPQAHSIIAANDFLPVRSQDDGTWRRIRVVRFESKFLEKPNPNDKENPFQFKIDWSIKDKFKKWVLVFMGMLIKIAKVQRGLVPMCNNVLKESNAYRRKEDFVSAFLEETFESCEPNPHDRLQKSVVQRLFADWYNKEYGEKISNKIQKVYDVMTKRYGELKKHPAPGWDGVRQIRVYAQEPNVEVDDTYEDEDEYED
jgi:P4 family phage/plasmid primase-like protien